MPTATLTSKGQITIPKHVRERLGLRTGDHIEFVEDSAGYRLQKRILDSPFIKYLGDLQELAGREPDELVAALRGR